MVYKPGPEPEPGLGLWQALNSGLAQDFQSPSPPKPGPSQGFEPEPGPIHHYCSTIGPVFVFSTALDKLYHFRQLWATMSTLPCYIMTQPSCESGIIFIIV